MKNIFLILSLILVSINCIAQVHIGPGQTFGNIEEAHNAAAIQPGDTVYLHAGSYTGYRGISELKGDSLNWIVFTRFNNDSIDISGCWQFMSCEYIKFLNLTFKANELESGRLINVDNGGSCETQSRHIIFDSCNFSGVTEINAITAFKFGGVDYFEVTNCVYKDMSSCSAFDFNVCHNGLIRGNRIENCLTGGHIKGGASDITMERNLFINASKEPWVAFELGGDTGEQFYCPGDNFEVKNLNFYSNMIIGGYRGLALSSAVDCNVVNNTFYNCGQATLRFLTTSNLFPQSIGNKVYNNIFSFGESAYINGSQMTFDAVTLRSNIYHSTKVGSFNGPYWDSELDAIRELDPMIYGASEIMYINPSSNDFHLAELSPAIGVAFPVSEPVTDFYGNSFSITARSIGAAEYIPPTGINEKKSNEDIVIYPNPATDIIEISYYLVNHTVNRMVNGLSYISIYNTLGECVIAVETGLRPVSTKRIDVSGLAIGMYFVRIGNYFKKFMVIR